MYIHIYVCMYLCIYVLNIYKCMCMRFQIICSSCIIIGRGNVKFYYNCYCRCSRCCCCCCYYYYLRQLQRFQLILWSSVIGLIGCYMDLELFLLVLLQLKVCSYIQIHTYICNIVYMSCVYIHLRVLPLPACQLTSQPASHPSCPAYCTVQCVILTCVVHMKYFWHVIAHMLFIFHLLRYFRQLLLYCRDRYFVFVAACQVEQYLSLFTMLNRKKTFFLEKSNDFGN